jgi:hypothetical protein
VLEVGVAEVVSFVIEKSSLGVRMASGEGISFKVLVSVSRTSFCDVGDIACKAAYICVILGADGPEGGVFGRLMSSSTVTRDSVELLVVSAATELDMSRGTSLLAAPAGGREVS